MLLMQDFIVESSKKGKRNGHFDATIKPSMSDKWQPLNLLCHILAVAAALNNVILTFLFYILTIQISTITIVDPVNIESPRNIMVCLV